MTPHRISIIIPTLNSSRTISSCLESIRLQAPRVEVVLIDRISVDGTAQIAQTYGAQIVSSSAGRSTARNMGVKCSSGDGILFVDSDMILESGLIAECEKGLESFDALLIPEISRGDGFWAKCKTAERKTYLGNDLVEAPRCFRRTSFVSIGGYDPVLEAGEDWDLYHRTKDAGFSVGRTTSKLIHDEGNLKLNVLLRKKYLYGKTIAQYVRKNPRRRIQQVNPFTRIIRPTIEIMRTEPTLALGVALVKSLEFAAAGLGSFSEILNEVSRLD